MATATPVLVAPTEAQKPSFDIDGYVKAERAKKAEEAKKAEAKSWKKLRKLKLRKLIGHCTIMMNITSQLIVPLQ